MNGFFGLIDFLAQTSGTPIDLPDPTYLPRMIARIALVILLVSIAAWMSQKLWRRRSASGQRDAVVEEENPDQMLTKTASEEK